MPSIAIGFPLKLLQAFRLAHALCETDLRVHVPEPEDEKFAYLRSVFGITYATGVDGIANVSEVEIDHEQPRTRIGEVARPLILPHGMIERCNALAKKRRAIDVSFCGLITPSRRGSIEAWVGAPLQEIHQRGADDGQMRLAFRARGFRSRRIEVWSSLRGRSYPIKAWDEDYFALLGRSRFVLCPPGDFVWTYRFFEAVLCGAVPVVEEASDIYEGFSYASMADGPDALVYDEDAVRANRARAVELLTVPHEQLRDAALAAARAP